MSDRHDEPIGAAKIAARILRDHIGRTETYATIGARAGLDALAGRSDQIGVEITAAITADARTVLPGQPVRYHGGITIDCAGRCAGVVLQPDPSQIIGVFDPIAPTEPDTKYPPIPPAGFYWARLDVENRWVPVEVLDNGVRVIVGIGGEIHPGEVLEWGSRLESPGSVPSDPRLTYAEAQKLKGALGAALLPGRFGGVAEVSRKVTGQEHAELEAAIARVTIQPAECRHDAWEWPMARCPACGTERR